MLKFEVFSTKNSMIQLEIKNSIGNILSGNFLNNFIFNLHLS